MFITRHNEVKYELSGNTVKIGEIAPNFTLKNTKGENISLTELNDKPLLISVVPDINTPVCSIQTARFNQEIGKIKDIHFITISTNKPEDFTHWCAAQGIENLEFLSDSEGIFGKNYGIYIETLNVDARATFVIDTKGVLLYEEIVPEMTNEPDYERAIKEIQGIL
ncbi:thiol peroxidase, atypical 2-Cys peroxiredoxin [Pilibacter termitis]|uniref:Thiol peroxidase, atypical 2-Cys peroxiredoxin n=1 Tax=Pilibacter termitis TaxID=263852 RepID=A0A1T4MD05_9ENTE|nr:thiol peroxidase [Pilibacter termitis]SJZ64747.1 thiol peroxidase, atypical 2-Cys peroxiredoxin [Pilibacter termitis]